VPFPTDMGSLAVWRVLRQPRARGAARGCVQAERCVVAESHGPTGPWTVWTPRVIDTDHLSIERARAPNCLPGPRAAGAMMVPPHGWEVRTVRREGSRLVSHCSVCQSETWLTVARNDAGPLSVHTLAMLRDWAQAASEEFPPRIPLPARSRGEVLSMNDAGRNGESLGDNCKGGAVEHTDTRHTSLNPIKINTSGDEPSSKRQCSRALTQ
jgi:hypothetical protein